MYLTGLSLLERYLFIVTKCLYSCTNVSGGSSQNWTKLMNASNMALPTSGSWSVGRRNSNDSASQSSAVLDPTSPGKYMAVNM